MPRGKAWTKAESLALVEAFIHISEDEIIGVNQRKETLFERVIAEAKQRYSGDWSRGTQACKSRWQIVSREVSKFIAADLLVSSIERSGWNEKDYYKATILAYHGVRGEKGTASDIHEDDLPLSDSEFNAPVPEIMGKRFRGKVRKTMLAYFQDTLETDGESLESADDDDNMKPTKTTK